MSDPFSSMSENTKHVVDGLSIATLIGSLSDVLPSIAAILTIIWTGLRIYESATVQGWLARRKGADE